MKLQFNEESIPYSDLEDISDNNENKNIDTRTYKGWEKAKVGQCFRDAIGDGGSMFGYTKVRPDSVVRTVVSNNGTYEWNHRIYRKLNSLEYAQVGTYPLDYDFQTLQPKYLIGMSVPPVMTAQIANQIYLQWFK